MRHVGSTFTPSRTRRAIRPCAATDTMSIAPRSNASPGCHAKPLRSAQECPTTRTNPGTPTDTAQSPTSFERWQEPRRLPGEAAEATCIARVHALLERGREAEEESGGEPVGKEPRHGSANPLGRRRSRKGTPQHCGVSRAKNRSKVALGHRATVRPSRR